MSKEYFANNFNLCLILPLMSLVAVLVSQIRLAHFLAQRNTLKRQEKYSQETISRLQSLYNQKDRCLSVLMHVVMVNLIYFTASALLFFKFSSEITHPFSLAFLILGLVLFVVTFSLLQYQPVSFKEFTSSFNKKVLFEKHYYLHLLVLSSSVALLGTFTTRPYIALIPSALMAVYTLILQPYKYTRQNLRSVFNYVVMCGWVILKTLIQHYPADSEPIFICYIVHIFGVLTLVVIISFISMAYNTHYEKLMKAKEKEIERQKKINDHRSNIKDKILRDLAKVDVTKQISDLTQQLIFKKTLNENENLLGFSNQKVSSLKEDQAMNEWKES